MGIRLGRLTEADQYLEAARQLGDRVLEARVLAHLAGQPSRAERYYRTGAEILQDVRQPAQAARALLNLGALMYQQGEQETARLLLSRSREVLRERGDACGAATALADLALVAREANSKGREASLGLARSAAARLEAAGDPAAAARVRGWLGKWEGS